MVSGRLIQLRSGPAALAPKEPEALAAPVAGFQKWAVFMHDTLS
jgi:hypothetical protein